MEAGREMDALVAEKVMGWPSQLPYGHMCQPGDTVTIFVADKTWGVCGLKDWEKPKVIRHTMHDGKPNLMWLALDFGDRTDEVGVWNIAEYGAGVRRYSTDTAADYSVLVRVRETWTEPMLFEFGRALNQIGNERIDRLPLGHKLRSLVMGHLSREPGDYSRAALAALVALPA